MPPQTPRTLQAWIKLLNSIRLPVARLAHERVSSAINDSNRSLREISERMQDSPALVLSVIREANMAVSNELVEPAESLEIAINRLGLKRTGELLRSLPAVEADDLPVALRQLQMISLHASQQANGLFAARLARLWQEIHWGSLLFLSPLWPLAISHPKLLEEWELRVIHKREPVAKVELELFGIRLLELCQAMAELWRLPLWIIQGYRLLQNERRQLVRVMHIARHRELGLQQQQELDSDPELRRWLNQPGQYGVAGQRPGAVGAASLGQPPQHALAVPDLPVPANALGRSAATGAPASGAQCAKSCRPRDLAPGHRAALAVGSTPGA